MIENFTLGLLIGDGSFQINHWKKKYLQYRIVIKLKKTNGNILMLQNIKNYYKIGRIKISNIKNKKKKSWIYSLNYR